MGTIFAHPGNHGQYTKWRSAIRPKSGLAGARLETAIFGLASSHPDLVAMDI